MDDIHVPEFAEYLNFLEPEPPFTKELDIWGCKYPSQKIHIYDWLECQAKTIDGAYGRKKPNESSKHMYNRFLNPGGLIWIADVLGEGEETLRQATAAAIEAEKTNYRGRCIAFRKVIPWDRILELFSNALKWRYDEKMLPLITFDSTTNYPMLKKGLTNEKRYKKLIRDEYNAAVQPSVKKKTTKAEKKERGWEA